MARIARVVIPGIPHHVTQRGNRRQKVFFSDGDYRHYLELLAEWCPKREVEIWAYCLMPNHVHLVAVPGEREDLAGAIGEVHRRYTRRVNFREGWQGYLWQGRFASYPMEVSYLLAAARYIENNPVRAGLARVPGEYQWSSARAHLAGRDDDCVRVGPLLSRVPDWRNFLARPGNKREADALRSHANTGRPLGSESFIDELEARLGRKLRPGKPGPKTFCDNMSHN